MRKLICIVMSLMVMLLFTQFSYAGEHGGKEHGGSAPSTSEHGGKEHGGEEGEEGEEGESGGEHGGKEHGGESEKKGSGWTSSIKPTPDNIRNTMKGYVMAKAAQSGTFDVYDADTGKTRRLSLSRVHERVGKTGDYYYSCADFKDVDSGELLDLDLDVSHTAAGLKVADVRIHKVGGNRRYTYDDNDNRIPLSE